jgi:hypothetical protein
MAKDLYTNIEKLLEILYTESFTLNYFPIYRLGNVRGGYLAGKEIDEQSMESGLRNEKEVI